MFTYCTELLNCTQIAANNRGWKEVTKDEEWNIYFSKKKFMLKTFPTLKLKSTQFVNHYPNHYELTRKDKIAINIRAMRQKTADPEAFDFLPTTYLLPSEYDDFEKHYHRCPNQLWIMKPPADMQANGIAIVRDLSQLQSYKDWSALLKANAELQSTTAKADITEEAVDESVDLEDSATTSTSQQPLQKPKDYIVQTYIANPLLLNERKFDLRIYVLVTSYRPLRAYLYRSGIARLCSRPYTLTPENYDDIYVHITNNSVQKKSEEYSEDNDMKESMQFLRNNLRERFGESATKKLFNQTKDIIIRSLESVQDVINNAFTSYELYGFDVMFDDTLKPWIIEVNASPSTTASSKADERLKVALVTELLDIVENEKFSKVIDMPPKPATFTPLERKGFDLICDGDFRAQECFLGEEHRLATENNPATL